MQHLLLDPKEVESEREVVIEERRTRTEDDPNGFLSEEVSSIAFRAHPYGFPVIGWMEDLKRLTAEQLRDFLDIAAHELRHPATLLKGYAMTISRHGGRMGRDTWFESLKAIEAGADRLVYVVEELLDVVRFTRIIEMYESEEEAVGSFR